MSDLKPCPFCGKTDGIRIESFGGSKYGVRCIYCQLKMGPWAGLQTAIDAWNRRVENAER